MMKRKMLFLFAATLLFANAFSQLTPTPFPGNTMVAITKKGLNQAPKEYKIYTSTTPPSSFSSGTPLSLNTLEVNGIGLNPKDNFVYGMGFNTANNKVSLLRIGAYGQTVSLGYLPTPNHSYVNYSSGTVTADGSFVYTTIGLGANNLPVAYLVKLPNLMILSGAAPLPTPSYEELDFTSDPDVKAAFDAYMASYLASGGNIFELTGGIKDLVYDKNGTFYSYLDYEVDQSTHAVNAFLITLGTPTGGKTPVKRVGNVTNTTPAVESAGLAFDKNNVLHILFVNGSMSTINTTTGALGAITANALPTSSNNLRGDLANMVPEITTPVTFGDFSANASGNSVTINWNTVSENNNKEFVIEVSKNGIDNWVKVKTIASKAENGNSTTGINYSTTIPLTGVAFAALSFLFLGFLPGKRNKLVAAALMLVVGATMFACSKTDIAKDNTKGEKVYVRLSQVDKDGTVKLLGIKEAVRK